ncbi:MAG: DegQ family serine endoprotease [Candidatus Competibacterales bacterium]
MMYLPRSLYWTSSLLLLWLVTGLAAAQQLPNFASLIEANSPSVVNVRSTRGASPTGNSGLPENIPEPFRRFFEDMPNRGMPNPRSQGSGFIISQDGYVLTNAHVVAGADEVLVGLSDRREYRAEVVGTDERTDVALLKIDTASLPAVELGDSDAVQVGDWVLAIGSPFGFERSATQGIVSALSRSLPDGTYVPFIQTDAAVNPGNSGGPLFNLDGEVIGINAQIYSRTGGYQGLSFAIPINVAMNVADQLRTEGVVRRGWLGVSIQDMNQALAESFGLERPQGALIAQVLPDSPAEQAGFEVGDVILAFNRQDINRSSNLPPIVGSTPVDQEVPVEVLRNGQRQTLQVTVGELDEDGRAVARSGPSSSENREGKLGLAVDDLNNRQKSELGVDRGVVVREVNPTGPAARAGVQEGDVILSFNNRPVESAEDFADMVVGAPADKPAVVLLKRDDNNLFVPIDITPQG